MRLIKHIVSVLGFFVIAASVHAQETEEQIQEKANKLFDKEQYLEATPFFLRLISLNPEDVGYNFRYGTCLLFNSDEKKKQAMRYLNFAVKSPSVDPRAFYFKARALHLNYQFKDAKKVYQLYQKRCSAKDNKFDVDRQIQMCDNGKRLLSTFTDIIVTEKKSIDEKKFFRLYHDMESIGGKILVTERFQSKIDKKKGHVPIVHFPKNATAVYYSSYGDTDANGLDIFIRKRLPDKTWGAPFRLPGDVNTPYDDDFPYLHPNGRYLYFSSKGHNSMGGYDVFMGRYNPASNGFEGIENVDFAICSPDDDLFYVVDSAYQNAYFASSRQSAGGKLHVYRVKVARIPIQEIIVAGDFLSEINPDNKEMYITVLNAKGDDIGQIKSNGVGKYSHVFPKGGKYTYQIEIPGMNQIIDIDLELPFLDEFRPLKQKIVHIKVDGGETVKIINLFDERIEGGAELIGPILRKKAELDINIDEFDPKELETIELAQKRGEILAELGLSGMAPREVQNKLNEWTEDERTQVEQVEKMAGNIDQNIINASKDLEELKTQQDVLIGKANGTTDPTKKYEYLLEANKIDLEIKRASEQIISLNELKGNIAGKYGSSGGTGEMASIKKRFNELIAAGDEEGAWNVLALEKKTIHRIQNSSPRGLIANMIDESIELKNEQRRLLEKTKTNTARIDGIEADIKLLKGQLPGAKNRQKKELEAEIASKQGELDIYKEENIYNRDDIVSLNTKVIVLDENVGILQDAIDGNPIVAQNPGEIDKAVREAKTAADDNLGPEIDQQLATLVAQNPELIGSTPITGPETLTAQEIIASTHGDGEKKILGDNTLTELEQTEQLITNNERTISDITLKINALQTQLDGDPENMDLLTEQMQLVQYKNELEETTNGYVAKVEELEGGNPEVAISKEVVIESIVPNYQVDVDGINGTPGILELDKLTQLQGKGIELKAGIDTRLGTIRSQLESDPNNPDLIGELQLLEGIAGELDEEIRGRGVRIEELENATPVTQITQAEVITDIFPTYQEAIDGIKNEGLSEVGELKALQLKELELRNTATTELTRVKQQLENGPGSPILRERKTILEGIIAKADQRATDYGNQALLLTSPPLVASTPEAVIEGLKPGHEGVKTTIIGNDGLTPTEQLEQLQVQDRDLMTRAQTALDGVRVELGNDPENPELKAREKTLEGIVATTSGEIDERTQTINALGGVSSVVDIDVIKTEIITAAVPDYGTRKEEMIEGGGPTVDVDLWELERELLDKLGTRKIEIENTAASNPDDQEAQTQLSAITALLTTQAGVVSTQRDRTLQGVLNTEVYTKTISDADKKYTIDIGDLTQASPRDNTAIADRELELQEKLQSAIDKKTRGLDRKYTVSLDLELMILEYELGQSKTREAAARNGGEVIAAQPGKTDFIKTIRADLLPGNATEVEKTYGTTEELETQDQLLEQYEIAITKEIEVLSGEPETPVTIERRTWLEEELATVRTKRGRISISLGELETEVIATTSRGNDPEMIKLDQNRGEILEELRNPELTPFERKELENSLVENKTAQTTRGNDLTEEEIFTSQTRQEALTAELNGQIPSGQDTTAATRAIDAGAQEREVIDGIVEQAEQADTEEERNYLLIKAQTRQAALINSLEGVVIAQRIKGFEEANGVTIVTRTELERRRRGYTIQIGDFDTRIIQVEQKMEEAKRRDLPGLQEEHEALIAQRALVAEQLNDVDARLGTMKAEQIIPVIAGAGLNQPLTFNEERTVAGSDEYKAYQVEGVKALVIENEIDKLDAKLEEERSEILGLMNGDRPELSRIEVDELIGLKTQRVKTLETQIEGLKSDLRVQSNRANDLLPPNQDEAMKMKNLLARGVQPIKTTAVALAIIQMPSNGLAIGTNTESVYTEENPIPVGVENPSGLTYRVQIGAFSRPIPQDLFKEFNPVSGEKIGTTGITRYMAGFFSNSDSVVDARQKIRGLGYRDAFVVAYCDGERITFGEARRREAAGICVPRGTNELMMEVAANTATHLGIPLTNEVQAVPELTYNQAPGAAPALPIELKQGLFFTVQIGVYNRPVGDERLKNLPEILTIRLPNGQIRYSTGMFDSSNAAQVRKLAAYEKGISDAFIVAYFEGKRITVRAANDLLALRGTGILQSNIEAEEPVVFVETPSNVVRTDTVRNDVVEVPVANTSETERIVQIVTKRTFEEFPRDILNRYNTEGNFYFDTNDRKVKSIIYDNTDLLPRLYKFKDDIDTVYLSQEQIALEREKKLVSVVITAEKVPGDLVDWLLRLHYSKRFSKTAAGVELTIEGIEPIGLESVLNHVRQVGLEPTVVEQPNEIEIEDK